MNIKNTSKKKHNKKYETPKNVGEKGQMNVKVHKYQKIKGFINTHIQMKQHEKDIYIGMKNILQQIQQIL